MYRGTDGKVLECTITRQRRPDVEEEQGDFRREKRNLGFSITVNLENTNDPEYLHLFPGEKDVENLYCKCKKIKRGKNTGLYPADETAVSALRKQAEDQEYIRKTVLERIYPLCEKFPA